MSEAMTKEKIEEMRGLLEYHNPQSVNALCDLAIAALSTAPQPDAQGEPKPVAWRYQQSPHIAHVSPWPGRPDEREGWEPLYSAALIAAQARELAACERDALLSVAEEFDRRTERDRALARDQSGVVGFGVTASFAAVYKLAADYCRERAALASSRQEVKP